MKIIFFIFSVLIFSSCQLSKLIKAINNSKINRTYGKTDFTISEQNQMIVKPLINGANSDFIFDTGAPFVLSDTNMISNIDEDKIIYFGKLELPSGEKIKNKSIAINFNLGFAKGENELFAVLVPYSSKCWSGLSKTKGIIGASYLNSLNEKGTFITLNFSDSIIENVEEYKFTELCENYTYIKSSFEFSKFYIYITVAGKEIKLLFDTGNSGSIILNSEDYNFESIDSIVNEGYMNASYSGLLKSKDKLIFDEPIFMGNNAFTSNINCSSGIKRNNFGLGVIKAFDWLIDYEHKKVYFKRNNKDIDNTFTHFTYKCAYLNAKLIIVQRELPNTKYNIGDEIISVDGIKITPENACDYGRLLNKTLDWNTVKVEVIPALPSDKN